MNLGCLVQFIGFITKNRFLFSDNENDIDMIEVEKDCDYFSMKKDLSTNGNVIEYTYTTACTLINCLYW